MDELPAARSFEDIVTRLRRLSARAAVLAAAIHAAMALLGSEAAAAAQPETSTMVGRIATVEPAGARIAVLPQDESQLAELMVAADAVIRHGERPITLSELVILVGSRVTIEYRTENGRRVSQAIIVEPD